MINPTCHECTGFCTMGRKNKKKENCPMIVATDILDEAMQLYYTDDDIRESTKNASIVEAKGYINWPRLKDTIEYAKLMKYNKLGLAYCIGLLDEAKKVAKILGRYGFEINSVCCKTGGVKKKDVGIPEEFTMVSKTGYAIGFTTCNPAAQALLLNKAKTEMNIIIGLCVGHDITFTKLSKAPVTTLIAKDRSSNHSPASILYTRYGASFFIEDLKKVKSE